LALTVAAAQAQSLDEAVLAARKVDAQYATQQAGVQSRRAQANQAGTAFWPYAGITYNQSDINAGGYSTRIVGLTQPLISYDRYLTLKQSDILTGQADAEGRQANSDMVLRVFSVMAEVIRSRESLHANEVQINGLQEQFNRAQRMRELGQGTVTEVSDFDARLAVARANRVSLQNALQTAQRQFNLLTGLVADVPTIGVEPITPWLQIETLEQLTAHVRENAPSVQLAQRALELAKIAYRRNKAQYVPQVNAQVARTQYAGNPAVNVTRLTIALSATLGGSQYYEDQRANAEILRAQESLRYAQEISVSEATRLFLTARVSLEEVAARQQALDATRQAVAANVKSYQGGVKSNTDVIASYQNQADAEVALVNSRLTQLETKLRLHLLIDDSLVSAAANVSPKTAS
jgi:protease secretion system outer membrane protein